MEREIDLLLPTTQNTSKITKFPFRQPLCWRLNHAIAFMTGGIAYLFGSYQYFPSINDLSAGAWLFVIGSIALLYADTFDWWMNNRYGCFYTIEKYRDSFEFSMKDRFSDSDTLLGKLQRIERGCNFFMSMIGSFLYLIGSILFIPSLDSLILGTYIFAYASAFIVFSETWKIYRSGCIDHECTKNNSFRLSNLAIDWPGFFVSVFTWLGGFGYFCGSIYYLPRYDLTTEQTIFAATWYTVAGASYVLAACFITFRYFFTINYLLRY